MTIKSKVAAVCSLVLCLGASAEASASAAAARATTEALVQSVMFKDSSPAMIAMFRRAPEFQAFYACVQDTLMVQNWTQGQHDLLMEMTGNTGNVSRIYYKRYTKAQLERAAEPMVIVSMTCT